MHVTCHSETMQLAAQIQLKTESQRPACLCAAKRDKQEAEGKAAHASADLQQHQEESQAHLQEVQQTASAQLQEAKDSSQDKMEGYCTNFRCVGAA